MRASPLNAMLATALLVGLSPLHAAVAEDVTPIPFDENWIHPFPNEHSVDSIATGDVDGDGNMDVVASAGENGTYYTLVYLGTALGGIGDPIEVAGGAGGELVVRDLNDDGRAEILYNVLGTGLYVKRMNTAGAITTSLLVAGAFGWSFDVGDIDGDERVDILLDQESPYRAAVAYQNDDGTFAPLDGWGSRAGGASLADMNNDGRLDRVETVGKTVTYRLQLEGGGLGPEVSSTFLGDWTPGGLAIGDFNADERPDVAVGGGWSNTGYLMIAYQQEDGSLTPLALTTTGEGGAVVGAADLDGDTDDDIVVLSSNHHRLTVYQGDPSGLLPPDPGRNHQGTQHLGSWGFSLEDLNGDGDVDVVSGSTYGELSISYGAAHYTAPATQWRSLDTAQELAVTTAFAAEEPVGTPLTYAIRSEPLHGEVTRDDNAFTYVSDPDFVGTDRYTVNISNGSLRLGTGNVTVRVHERGALEGRVVTIEDHEVPVAGIEVAVHDSSGAVTTTTSDANGEFDAPYLPAGATQVRFHDPSGIYLDEWYHDSPTPTVGVHIGEGETVGINERLVPSGVADPAVVTTTVDGGPGSLRRAVGYASTIPGPNTIELGTDEIYELTCNGGGELLSDNGDLTIRGNGATIRQTCAGARVLRQKNSGTLTLADVTLTGGSTPDNGGAVVAPGPVVIRDGSVIEGNHAGVDGGGIWSPSSVEVLGAAVRDNHAGRDGGGFYSAAHVWLHDSTVSGNQAETGDGGGFVAQSVGIERSTVADNSAGGDGGGLRSRFASAQESTFSGNEANRGGGIAVLDSVSLQRSTLSDNTADSTGGAILLMRYGPVELDWVTAIENSAPVGSALGYLMDAELRSFASVLAPTEGDSTPLCALAGGTTESTYSFATDTSCSFDDPTDNPTVGDPLVGPLADNGGSTRTHRPLSGSPLVGVVPVADGCGGVDQRGVDRPVEELCEIGAVETRVDNNPPVLDLPPVTSYGGWPVSFELPERDEDGDRLEWTVGVPVHGHLEGTPPALTYHPDIGFEGSESVGVVADDLQGASVVGSLLVVSTSFSDVPPDHPFHDDITWVATEGIAAGYAGGFFRPVSPVTRQAAAAFLYRLAGEPNGDFPDPGFVDVGSGHPFFHEISWAVDVGIVNGYPDESFRPGQPVTRQAAVAFLYRMAGSPPPSEGSVFSDVGPNHPFANEIRWASHHGLVDGYPDGTFRPGAVVSRQAMAAFLHRFSGLDP